MVGRELKNLHFYLKLIAVIGFLLLIITFSQSYLEYRSGKKAILTVFENQAELIIHGAANAGEKGLIAYQSLLLEANKTLTAVAECVDISWQTKQINRNNFSSSNVSNNLSILIFFKSTGTPSFNFPDNIIEKIDTTYYRETVSSFLKSDKRRLELGFISAKPDFGRHLALLYKGEAGNVMLVGVSADDLENRRRAFGTGSIIEDLSNSEGVRYAAIYSDNNVLVATRDFPVYNNDTWYGLRSGGVDILATRFKSFNFENNETHEVFEARGPFYISGQYYGNIVVGLDTSVLNTLIDRIKSNLIWRSALSLLLTIAMVAGVIVWYNSKLLSRKYVEIKTEVEELEADRSTKARLVSMGELAGGMAHEIRNPLNAIGVIIQRFKREFVPVSDKDEYIELADIVMRETNRINDSIEQFLKMSRPPSLNKTDGNLNDCLQAVLKLFLNRANQKNIKVKTQFENLPIIEFDEKLISQAVLNLLENALDAVGENGEIVIKTYYKNNYIGLEIADNGSGISDKLKERVFDMYFTTKERGTGMGLPSVLMTIKEHKGHIEIIDNDGGGTIFRMEIPGE